MRIPKFRGFNNPFREEFQIVPIDILDLMEEEEEITPEVLYDYGLIKHPEKPVKILANGEIHRAVTVKAHKFSENAKEAIERAGGKAEVI